MECTHSLSPILNINKHEFHYYHHRLTITTAFRLEAVYETAEICNFDNKPRTTKNSGKSIKSHKELYISLTFSMVFRNVLRYQHHFKLCHVAIFCATNFVTNFVLFFAYSHFSYHLGFLFLNFNKYYSVL